MSAPCISLFNFSTTTLELYFTSSSLECFYLVTIFSTHYSQELYRRGEVKEGEAVELPEDIEVVVISTDDDEDYEDIGDSEYSEDEEEECDDDDTDSDWAPIGSIKRSRVMVYNDSEDTEYYNEGDDEDEDDDMK